MTVNSKDYNRALESISPEYFGEDEIWRVFTDGEKRNVRLTATDATVNRKRFLGALRSPCCQRWRYGATTTHLALTLTGPEDGMEITYSLPIAPKNYISEDTRWEIYGTLRDYPPGMPERVRMSDAIAVHLGIVNLAPRDSAV